MDLKQTSRNLAVDCPALPDGKVLATRVFLAEELGRPFRCELELLAEDGALDMNAVVGQKAAVKVLLRGENLAAAASGDIRLIHGKIAEFEQLGSVGELFEYRAVIVPDVWFLSQTRTSRIFQNKKVPEIVLAVCKEAGFADFDDRLKGTYEARQHCVQYRESSLDFISRIMEEEGIYYYFKHSKSGHTMVLCDDSSAHEAFPGFEKIPFGLQGIESIAAWKARQTVRPTEFKIRDYDFKQAVNMSRIDAQADGQFSQTVGTLSVYDYPGAFTADTFPGAEGKATDVGGAIVKVRACEGQSGIWEARGRSGNVAGLSAGFTFELTGHPRKDFAGEYLVSRLELSASSGLQRSESPGGEGRAFHCSFAAHKSSGATGWKYTPRRLTQKPVVPGLQTAVVMGPGKGSDEIWTDEWGRIQIRFHWDMDDAKENTCWVRVAQTWAGAGFGALFIPRVDQEVVVAFLEGDPDRPLVVGSVYNETNKPPVKLPDEATRSTVRTNTTPSEGSNAKFNEIRFDDKKDKEEIYVHAQKDVKVEILNDRTTTIKHDEIYTIENDRTGTVKKNETLTVEENRTRTVKKDEKVTVEGAVTRSTGKDETVEVKKNLTEDVKDDHSEKIGKNLTIEAGTKITLKVGGSEIAMTSSQIELKTGQSKITMAAAEVTIESVNINVKAKASANVEAGAAAKVKGTASAALQGAMVDVKADGIATVKGSLTMIG